MGHHKIEKSVIKVCGPLAQVWRRTRVLMLTLLAFSNILYPWFLFARTSRSTGRRLRWFIFTVAPGETRVAIFLSFLRPSPEKWETDEKKEKKKQRRVRKKDTWLCLHYEAFTAGFNCVEKSMRGSYIEVYVSVIAALSKPAGGHPQQRHVQCIVSTKKPKTHTTTIP